MTVKEDVFGELEICEGTYSSVAGKTVSDNGVRSNQFICGT